MTTQEVKRKLTAILSADVKGYSRLMGQDEKGTLGTLNAYKQLMAGLIQHHHGRMVDASGDNLLAEFVSVVDAVECGVEIQKELKTRNSELPENRRMEFRIGINLGDVIEEGNRIYGDGVNIAARLESLSEAGGICLSGTVYDQVKNKLSLEYGYLGKQSVKNIIEPVRVYRVLTKPGTMASSVRRWKRTGVDYWNRIHPVFKIVIALVAAANAVWQLYPRFISRPVEVTPKDKMAFPLSGRPSIAVLPFVNMSRDPEQEFFSDGMTEEIITTLSKSPYLSVVARTSTFAYKGKSIPVDQVALELKVRYVLEGSVRRAGDRIRITAQLIDAKTGHHQWAERYEGEVKDVFAIQDEIALKIMKTLQVKLRVEPSLVDKRGGSKNAEAYLKSLEANEQLLRGTGEGTSQARRLFEEVIALEPDFSRGYSGLALCIGIETNSRGRGGNVFYNESMARAMDLAQKALSLNETDAFNHAAQAYLFVLARQHDKAIAHAERALALDTNSFLALDYSACALMYSCKGKEALAAFEKAERLNPSFPFMPIHLCWTYLVLGRYEEAFEQAQEAVQRNRQFVFGQWVAQLLLAATCNLTGREAEARAAAGKVLEITPKFTVGSWRYNLAFKDNDQIDLAMNALRKAGLK